MNPPTKQRHLFLTIGVFWMTHAFFASTAEAGLIVNLLDTTIVEDGMGTVDVLIRSDSMDNVDLANYEFQISSVFGSSVLTFTSPEDPSEETDPNYLFAGDNVGIFANSISATQFIGSDLTDSGTGVNLSTSDRLLVRLDIEHALGIGQVSGDAVGDQFRISLINSADTFFEDALFDPVAIDPSSFSTANSSLVTITTVPEPTSLLLFGSVFAVYGLLRRPKRPFRSFEPKRRMTRGFFSRQRIPSRPDDERPFSAVRL